jgi:hypothetical protein
VYNYCNIRNIPIYFCKIHTETLEHIFETIETLKTYAVEREDGGRSGAVESATSAWLRWSTPW